MRNEVLLFLDLGDNIIGNEGAKFLGHALKVNKTLLVDKNIIKVFKIYEYILFNEDNKSES